MGGRGEPRARELAPLPVPVAVAAARPAAAVDGLTAEAVRERVAAGLVNRAPRAPSRTLAQILRANVLTRFNAILGALVVVVAIVGPLQDELFGLVLVVNTLIGVAQELRARQVLSHLALLSAARAQVVRDGKVEAVAAEEVVEDDVLELAAGDQVVVDGEVLVSDGLELDEALLTGEGEPVAAGVGAGVRSGTAVVAGRGRIRASRVGAQAYAAGLEREAARFSLIRSELQQGTNRILQVVSWVMVPTGVALLLSQLLRVHQGAADALRGSAAGVAAMVPEGLVLLTSVAFALGGLRLARRRVLVQELAAVEGLARVDVVCLDKTGTLTRPGMSLAEVELLGSRPHDEVGAVLRAMFEADPAPNASARALAEAAPVAVGWPVRARVPFSSARRWSAVSFDGHGAFVLGAPELFGHPTTTAAAGRILFLGRLGADPRPEVLPAVVEPLALVHLAETLRPDAAATVSYLLAQGVRLKVLSGDAPATVASIASRAGIDAAGAADASALGDDRALAEALQAGDVLGRIRPDQKRAAVRVLQEGGHVVAMIGDGVNDVLALKQADLGIAMGSGSAAARAVARVVLLDSAFSSVPTIVDEGRRVVANIERVARLFLVKTVYAALLAAAVAVSGLPYPFYPRHLTVLSALTIGVPAFFMAFAPGAPRAAPGFVARVLAFSVPAGFAAFAAGFATYAIARLVAGVSPVEARTAALLALAVAGLWVLVLVASPLDAWRGALVAAMAAGFVLPFVTDRARRLLGVELPPAGVLVTGGAIVASALLLLGLWRKVIGPGRAAL